MAYELDSATNARLALVYPDVAVRIRRVYQDMFAQHGAVMATIEGLRTLAAQEENWAKGRTKQPDGSWLVTDKAKIVTNAKPGDSLHGYGCAVDSVFRGNFAKDPYLERMDRKLADSLWNALGHFGQAHGLTWGYDWNGNGKADANDFDRPHLEIRYGLTLSSIKDIYAHGGLVGVYAAFDRARGVEVGTGWNGIPGMGNRIIVGSGSAPK